MDAFKQKAITTREGALRATAVVAGAAKDMFTTREGALRATAVVAGAAKDVFTTREGALRATAVVAGAVGTYFFWPAAVTMKAPSAAGFIISRAAFVGNPQLYFHLLRTAGAAAAAGAFAPAAAVGAAAYAPAAAAGAAGAAAAFAL